MAAQQGATAEVGGTATLVIAGTVWDASIDLTSLSLSGRSRQSLDTSHFGLAAYDSGVSAIKTFIPSGLIDGGEFTCGVTWNMELEPPISLGAQDITITFANTGSSSAGAMAFSGFLTEYSVDGELDGKWEGSVTIKVAGPTETVADFWVEST
jgi:hypothetical protein